MGLWRTEPLVAGLLALILLGATETHGQLISVPREHFFRMEWRPQVEGQRHVIAGYLHNHYRHPITDVQVRVEIFDASGQPMGDTHARLTGEIPPGGRSYFVVPVPAGGAAFGVTVHSFAFVPVESP